MMDLEEGNLIHSITSSTERERERIEEEIDLSDEEEG